jgi:hypothetical protein
MGEVNPRLQSLYGMDRKDEDLLILVQAKLLVDLREGLFPVVGICDHVGRGTSPRPKLEKIRHVCLPPCGKDEG